MCADQERFVSRWIPSKLNVETRSIAPNEVLYVPISISVSRLYVLYASYDYLLISVIYHATFLLFRHSTKAFASELMSHLSFSMFSIYQTQYKEFWCK